MIGLILLGLGGIYAVNRPKISRLTVGDVPGVPGHVFDEWKRYELRSIDLFLLITWGRTILFTLITLIIASSMGTGTSHSDAENLEQMLLFAQIAIFVIGIIASA